MRFNVLTEKIVELDLNDLGTQLAHASKDDHVKFFNAFFGEYSSCVAAAR